MGRGEESLLCDPGSELRLGGREKGRVKIINTTKRKQEIRKKKPLARSKSSTSTKEGENITHTCDYVSYRILHLVEGDGDVDGIVGIAVKGESVEKEQICVTFGAVGYEHLANTGQASRNRGRREGGAALQAVGKY